MQKSKKYKGLLLLLLLLLRKKNTKFLASGKNEIENVYESRKVEKSETISGITKETPFLRQ
jgi:hypothetical protein